MHLLLVLGKIKKFLSHSKISSVCYVVMPLEKPRKRGFQWTPARDLDLYMTACQTCSLNVGY